MGGNALNIPVKRLLEREFKEYEQEVCQILQKKFQDLKPTLYYKNKKDFGDLDIIVVKPNDFDKNSLNTFLKENFKTKEIFHNSDVISFEYKDFQVDLIFVKPEDFITAHFYFSYNDLHNLIGRVAYQLGLKFGFDGLSFVIRDELGSNIEKHIISKDPEKIYGFLDLDYQKYLKGFDELEDVFNFVTETKYFNSSIFSYENLNHQNRTRNKKRKTYASFLLWLENKKFNNYTFKNKADYIQNIEDHFKFPIKEKIDSFYKKIEEKKELSKKFNGNIVKEVLNISDNDLGNFIKKFKSNIIDFEIYLKENSKEQIEKDIKNFNDLKI